MMEKTEKLNKNLKHKWIIPVKYYQLISMCTIFHRILNILHIKIPTWLYIISFCSVLGSALSRVWFTSSHYVPKHIEWLVWLSGLSTRRPLPGFRKDDRLLELITTLFNTIHIIGHKWSMTQSAHISVKQDECNVDT